MGLPLCKQRRVSTRKGFVPGIYAYLTYFWHEHHFACHQTVHLAAHSVALLLLSSSLSSPLVEVCEVGKRKALYYSPNALSPAKPGTWMVETFVG